MLNGGDQEIRMTLSGPIDQKHARNASRASQSGPRYALELREGAKSSELSLGSFRRRRSRRHLFQQLFFSVDQ